MKIKCDLNKIIRFADGIAMTSQDEKYVETSLKKLNDLSMQICNLNIDKTKTKIMKCTLYGDQIYNSVKRLGDWPKKNISYTWEASFRPIKDVRKRSDAELLKPNKPSVRRKVY